MIITVRTSIIIYFLILNKKEFVTKILLLILYYKIS